jgi:hypothetical protein
LSDFFSSAFVIFVYSVVDNVVYVF